MCLCIEDGFSRPNDISWTIYNKYFDYLYFFSMKAPLQTAYSKLHTSYFIIYTLLYIYIPKILGYDAEERTLEFWQDTYYGSLPQYSFFFDGKKQAFFFYFQDPICQFAVFLKYSIRLNSMEFEEHLHAYWTRKMS